MSKLFKELKGKDIRIKTWGEMLEMENTSLFKDRVILFLDNYGNAFTNFPSTAEHLCGKIIKVDETMITDDLFKMYEGGLKEDRELLYYDEENDNCYYLDKDMFEQWIDGPFTKTVCQAKNKNQLMKAVTIAEELGLKEGEDFFLIKDNCLTDLEPEEIDDAGVGRTLTCIGFRPLPDETAHAISKKFHLYV